MPGGTRSTEQRGGAAYGELIAAQRRLQDLVAGAVLPAELVAEVTKRLAELGDLLAAHQADEAQRWDGWRPDLPGRASPLLPPYEVDERARAGCADASRSPASTSVAARRRTAARTPCSSTT